MHKVGEEILREVSLGMGGDAGIGWDRNTRRQVLDYVRDAEVERMILGLEVLQFLQDVHRPKTPPSTMEVIKEMSYCRVRTSSASTHWIYYLISIFSLKLQSS